MGMVEMKVPTIGESITEVTLSQWLKEDGAWVELDEPICEFESDKATLEFPAEAAGTLHHVAKEGDDLEIGALVAKIDTDAEQSGNGQPSASGKEKEPEEEGNKKEEQKAKEKEEKTEKTKSSASEKERGEDGEKSREKKSEPAASPAAAKILREADIEPGDVSGTGKDGRITKEDAQKAATAKSEKKEDDEKEEPKAGDKEQKKDAKKEKTPVTHEKLGLPDADRAFFSRDESRKKMSRMRRTIARRLVSAKNETAMLTTFNEIDMTAIMELRKKYQDDFQEKYGIKLGFMSLFAKACARVLLEMPEVNAFIDGEEFVYHDYVDISIAISTPNGLVVPPVRNVESLGFHEIEKKIKELAEKARDGSLSLEEMQGGTFTITNGGIFGSLLSTPIINEPQSAILGMHAIKDRPVVIDGQVVIRPMMYVALSYDHRVIDGSSSVTFLVKVKEALEDPVRMLFAV